MEKLTEAEEIRQRTMISEILRKNLMPVLNANREKLLCIPESELEVLIVSIISYYSSK